MRKNNWFIVMMIALSLSLVAAGCGGQSGSGEGKSHTLKVATNNTQTSWYMFTAALDKVLNNSTPAIKLDILPFAGGTGNVELVTSKEADFALSFNITNKWAYDGIVAYDKKFQDIRGLVGGLNQYYIGIVARSQFLKDNNITSLAQINEKKIPVRVITNPVGSLAEFNTRQVLEAYGLSYDAIKSNGGTVELTSNDVIKSKFQNGTADLHILAMTKGHPVITEMGLQTDITVMPMEDNIREWFKQYGYTQEVFPKGEFKEQNQDVNTVGFVAGYITHKDMSDDVAYAITKAVVENKETLVSGHSSVEDFDPKKAAQPDMLGIPIHPGAERYYKEAGILK